LTGFIIGVPALASVAVITVTEVALRQSATRLVKPEYPKSSQLAGRTGVAVARVKINEQGMPTAVLVVQSPDKAIEGSVEQAVKACRFKFPINRASGFVVNGRLTFYFRLVDGIYSVSNPDEF
jgi:TonB family protein